MTDRETLDVYDEKAGDYARVFDNDDKPGRHLRRFLDHVPAAADLLDLGCGPGQSAALMAQAGHRVTATDASSEMVRLARAHQDVTVRQETFDDLVGQNIYDGIWANFALLHADRGALPRHLTQIAQALRTGGIFHIGMKTGEGTKRDGIGRRYTYVSQEELTEMLETAGLTITFTDTGRDPGLDGTVAPWVVLQAIKA